MVDGGLLDIDEHWHFFLLQNPDARLVADDIIARTGLSDDEALFFLLDAWARQNLTPEQRDSFDDWVSAQLAMD
jgi:hypothetical protein